MHMEQKVTLMLYSMTLNRPLHPIHNYPQAASNPRRDIQIRLSLLSLLRFWAAWRWSWMGKMVVWGIVGQGRTCPIPHTPAPMISLRQPQIWDYSLEHVFSLVLCLTRLPLYFCLAQQWSPLGKWGEARFLFDRLGFSFSFGTLISLRWFCVS